METRDETGALGTQRELRREGAAMAASFVLLEWLNHAVVNPHAFLSGPEYGEALVPGVPNPRLFYALASFYALGLLWAVPFPGARREPTTTALALRSGVVVSSAAILVGLAMALGAGWDWSGVAHSPAQPGEVTPTHTPIPHRLP